MAIDTLTPIAGSVIAHGDTIAFTVDDTYTSMVIQADLDAGLEAVYLSASGGYQAGYTGTVVNSGGRDTFTFSRNSGWDKSPLLIHVTEDETGTPALTTTSYTLSSQTDFPQGSNPYNPIYVGTLLITEDDVQVRKDVGWIDFDDATFDVTDLGNGKVRIVATASGSGDVVSSESGGTVDGEIVVFDDTTGKLVRKAAVTEANVTANNAKVTNATHTGDVTGSGALTIGAKKVTAAMMEDGVDGELFTWDASGVLAKVAVGTNGQVLTSNGPGAAPTMQAAAGGTLDATITGGTPDNNVIIPNGDHLIFNEAGGGDTDPILSVIKTTDTTAPTADFGVPASGYGIRIYDVGTAGIETAIEPDAIKPGTLGTNFVFGNRDGIAGHAGGGYNILAGQWYTDASAQGGHVSIQGGNAASGTDGNVYIGDFHTDETIIKGATFVKVEGPIHILEAAAATTDVAGYGQLWVKNDSPNTLWFTDDVGTDVQLGVSGGGTPNPAFSFTHTQITDGSGNPATGEWRVKTGASGTPSGITELRFHPTDVDSDDQSAAMNILGQGDHVKIWKASDPTEWYIYKLTATPSNAGASWTAAVEHVGDSGGTFDQAEDWNFFWYTGSKIQVYTYQESFDVTLASNLNYQTLDGVDTGVTTFPTNAQLGDTSRAGMLAMSTGTVISIGVSGYCTAGASTQYIIYRGYIHDKTANTVTDLTVSDLFFRFQYTTNNVWVDGSSGGYIDGGGAAAKDVAAAGPLIGVLAKRGHASAPTSMRFVVTIRYIVGI